MKGYRLYIWIFLAVLFILNQTAERIFHFYYPVLFSYLDDIMCIPIILGAYQVICGLFNPHKKKDLPLKFILISVFSFSVWFELIIPVLSPKYTADILDVVMYITGGLFYYLFFNSTFLFRSYANKKKIGIQGS